MALLHEGWWSGELTRLCCRAKAGVGGDAVIAIRTGLARRSTAKATRAL